MRKRKTERVRLAGQHLGKKKIIDILDTLEMKDS